MDRRGGDRRAFIYSSGWLPSRASSAFRAGGFHCRTGASRLARWGLAWPMSARAARCCISSCCRRDIPTASRAVLAVYVLGHMLGVASHVPGGVGAFEATNPRRALRPGLTGKLLSSLLIYRCHLLSRAVCDRAGDARHRRGGAPRASLGAAIWARAKKKMCIRPEAGGSILRYFHLAAGREKILCRQHDLRIGLADRLCILARIVEGPESRPDAFEPRAQFVIGADNRPGRSRVVGALERFIIGIRILIPAVDRLEIERRELQRFSGSCQRLCRRFICISRPMVRKELQQHYNPHRPRAFQRSRPHEEAL